MTGERVEGAEQPRLEPVATLTLQVWNLMGGEINWTALPWMAELLGCDDLDGLVDLLVTTREHLRPGDENNLD
jgi:hypothetical protein